MWQIAQRDYRFGKGKHSSLTKATYDAIGNKFRQLWGKEAGWAHSVLFTADLRAFSERLVAKHESTSSETIIKEEAKELVVLETAAEARITSKLVKRANEETEHDVVSTERTTRTRAKRRRRS